MRRYILLMLLSFHTNFAAITQVNSQDGSAKNPICTDQFGKSYNPGDSVLSEQRCTECVCGSRGNIICEDLNEITECQPPKDAPCRRTNGTICCDRSFSCKRLASCFHDGVLYQAGEVVEHTNAKCQQCRCGADGRVKCQPVAGCEAPAWIAELGGTDCSPVYAGNSCCPTDYVCRCVVFNDTVSREPRNVARCATCSCSQSGGVESCEAVACKIPHKFSDKCRPVYRGDDCCPIDYDCTINGAKEKNRLSSDTGNEAVREASTKATFRRHRWDGTEARAVKTPVVLSDDILPYGLNEFNGVGNARLLGRSDDVSVDVVMTTILPTDPMDVTDSIRQRHNEVMKKGQTAVFPVWQTVNASNMGSGTEALLVVSGDSLRFDPQAMVIQSKLSAAKPSLGKSVIASTDPAADTLVNIFVRVAEKPSKSTTNLLSHHEILHRPSDLDHLNRTVDVLEYGTPKLVTTPKNTSHEPDLSDRFAGVPFDPDNVTNSSSVSSTGVAVTSSSTLPENEGQTSKELTNPPELSKRKPGGVTLTPFTMVAVDGDAVTEAGHTDFRDTTPKSAVEMSTVFRSTSREMSRATASIDSSTENARISMEPSATQTSIRRKIDRTTFVPPVTTTALPFRSRFIGATSPNMSRFSLDTPFFLSSSDAGFLADDLSYKLFSANFFRSPVVSLATTVQPPTQSLVADRQPSILDRGNGNHLGDGIAIGQGQVNGLLGVNSTGSVNEPVKAGDMTELDPLIPTEQTPVNVTLPPDFEVVTFGGPQAGLHGGRKTAGKILFPPAPGGLGGGGGLPPMMPFETEVEFKGFGMMPEIEIKPLSGLAGLAGMAMMAAAGRGSGASMGGQLAAATGSSSGGARGGSAMARMAAAAAAPDAMEELLEGGTGDGAFALAAAMMHNPRRPIPARLMDGRQISFITTTPTTATIIYHNGTNSVSLNSVGDSAVTIFGTNTTKTARFAEFNALFNSLGSGLNQYSGLHNQWASAPLPDAAVTTIPVTTADPAAATKEPFPFEVAADVIEEGGGPALTQLMGMMGGGMDGGVGGGMSAGVGGGMGFSNPFGMLPHARGGMMNGFGMAGLNRNFFPSYGSMLGGLSGMGGMGMESMGGLLAHRGMFNMFTGSLSDGGGMGRQDWGRLMGSRRNHFSAAPSPRSNPAMNSPSFNYGHGSPQLRQIYKVGGLTEAPLAGLIDRKAAMPIRER